MALAFILCKYFSVSVLRLLKCKPVLCLDMCDKPSSEHSGSLKLKRSGGGYKLGKQQQLEGVTHTVHINHPGPAYHKHTVKL